MSEKDRGHKARILVVEPDDLIRDLLERWLGEAGYEVEVLDPTSGSSVTAPDLIVLNVERPREANALIRTLAERHQAPIAVVSARFRRGLGASSDTARRLGVRAVLPKPFTRDELLIAIEQSIRK